MKTKSKQIAVAGVGSAIATLCIILAIFTPLSFSVLTIASLCYFIVFVKAGIVFGILSIVASNLLSMLFGIDFSIILNAVLFSPYAIFAYLLKNVRYIQIVDGKNVAKLSHVVIRAFAIVLFAVGEFFAMFFIVKGFFGDVFTNNIIYEFIANGYFALGVAIFIGIVAIVDIIFSVISNELTARIKI